MLWFMRGTARGNDAKSNVIDFQNIGLTGVVFRTRSGADVSLDAPRENIIFFSKLINLNNYKLIFYRDYYK